MNLETAAGETRYLVERHDQLELLASSVRQEILDTLSARGPSSIAELSEVLGTPADTLYYHVKKLLDGDLVVVDGERPTGRRPELVYRLPARSMSLRYDPADAVRSELVAKVVGSALRTAIRDFGEAAVSGDVVAEGPGRTLWGARCKAWLNPAQVEEANVLLNRLRELFEYSDPQPGGQLFTIAWALAPVNPKPKRRT